jgi:hypothetical protein
MLNILVDNHPAADFQYIAAIYFYIHTQIINMNEFDHIITIKYCQLARHYKKTVCIHWYIFYMDMY